ncbi:RsmB/NOP family class I SAM-dependent RNA methyltransferase [Cohnella sp. 56]|uniref:RsmB/NOP family class I SAM-dependent RNA methyltransferase n=1 Tax=Cohnella sp. 56 TaxID=3113722 RepID=UPI0030EAB81A
MQTLPQIYIERIADQLGEETDAFLRSMASPRAHGLRIHAGKLRPADNPDMMSRLIGAFDLKPVPWCGTGYTYDPAKRPGKHPYHHAGLYYIQEPSAMIAAELLDPRPGEIVLDLAAAPGGKTTQIAAKMQGGGLLVANEIHPGRARILSENVERLGIGRAVVVSATPGQLAARLPLAFDRIMLDAPCSGEGMFRKEPEAVAEWSPDAVAMCAARQRDILPDAAAMLKPGGRLVYSTCTFNREENEETIAWFLASHPEFSLLEQRRMWPHRGEGEGHFAAVLVKRPASSDAASRPPDGRDAAGRRAKGKPPRAEEAAVQAALKQYREFAAQALPGFELSGDGVPLLFGESLYWYPQPAASPLPAEALGGLRTLRPGLHLGDSRKGRFEPSHALALAASAGQAAIAIDYDAHDDAIAAFLRGEALPDPGSDARGWGLLCANGYPLGWFKASDGQLKNHYPKGLRTN